MNAQTKIEPVGIVAALAKALPELESAKKNKANPAFKSKYADLAAVIEAIDPIRVHGLWYRQVSHDTSEGVSIETIYIHDSGAELSAGSLFMPATKKDAQGFGSALTYCRRYSLQSAFGLATEDDDGNADVKAGGGQSSSAQSAPAGPTITTTTPDLPTGPINDTTRDWLASKIDARQIPVGDLCRAFGAASLKQITYAQLDLVKAWIADWKPKASFGEVLADEIPY